MRAIEEPLARHYREHSGAVHRVATLICGSDLAADVTQEVFSQLWRNPGAFDPERGSMRAFLMTAARYRAIDLLRSERSRRNREVRTGPVFTMTKEVDHQHLGHEISDQVVSALQTLPMQEREAIVIAYYGGCTYREVAAVLGAPEGTIKSRIRSGLQRLRILLDDMATVCAAPSTS